MVVFSSVLIITAGSAVYASLLKFCSRDPYSPEHHHEEHNTKKDLSRFACKPWQNNKKKNYNHK
tara:strand:+ start:183 stop:374 length:192 start_codon:yes stop_codon:yes gene_type:complete